MGTFQILSEGLTKFVQNGMINVTNADAKKLIEAYKDDVIKANGVNVPTFEAWRDKTDGLAADVLKRIPEANREKAKTDAATAINNDPGIKAGMAEVDKDKNYIFKEGKSFVEKNPAGLIATVLTIGVGLLTGIFGEGIGGWIATALAAAGIGAAVSYIGDQDGMVKGMVSGNTPAAGQGPKAGNTQVPETTLGAKPIAAVDRNVDKNAPASATNYIDVNMSADPKATGDGANTLRVYGTIGNDNKFTATESRLFQTNNPAISTEATKFQGSLVLDTDNAKTNATLVAANSDVLSQNATALQTAANEAAQKAVAAKEKKEAAEKPLTGQEKAMGEADLVSGKTKIKVIQTPGNKEVEIKLTSQSTDKVSRSFRGTTDELGNLTLTHVMEVQPGEEKPKAVELKDHVVLPKVGVEGGPVNVDEAKLLNSQQYVGMVNEMSRMVGNDDGKHPEVFDTVRPDPKLPAMKSGQFLNKVPSAGAAP